MIRGIGVDTVTISDIKALSRDLKAGSLAKMFTTAELKASYLKSDPAEYLATRFASKEAVFKAVAHLLEEKHFDMRIVETLNHEDGSPYVNMTDHLRAVLDKAEVQSLHLSITTEGDYATAFVVAE